MTTLIEYFVFALGLGCILIGLGAWLLPYAKRWRNDDDDEDLDEDIGQLDMADLSLQTLARAGIKPTIVEAPARPPGGLSSPEPRPRTDLLSAVATAPEAPSAAVAARTLDASAPSDAAAEPEPTLEADTALDVEVELAPVIAEVESETVEHEEPAPEAEAGVPAGNELDADLLSLFSEVEEESKVPAVLKEAIEAVTIEALLAEAREVRALMERPSR